MMWRVFDWINSLQERLKNLAARPYAFGSMAENLLSGLSPEELLHLEGVFGRMSFYSIEGWDQITPAEVQKIATGSHRSWALGLLSFHRNGYVRHAAVRLLALESDGSELRYLAIRQNDWVEPISRDARAAVQQRLTTRYLPEFVEILPLVFRLLAFTRYEHSQTVQSIVELLCRPQHASLLSQALDSPHRITRRQVTRIALDLPGEHRRDVIKRALASDDGVLRLWCCRAVPSIVAGPELASVLQELKKDRFMPARREALRIQAQAFPKSARVSWMAALLDANPAIRQLARFELRKLGSFHAAVFYHDVLNAEPACVTALCGFGETGDASDLPVMRSYLASPIPALRRAAVRGLVLLGRESVVDDLVQGMADASPAVVREARNALVPMLHLVDPERLFRLTTSEHPWHVQRAACRLIFELGRWKSLPWLVRLTAGEDARVSELAQQLANAWFSPPRSWRVFTTLEDTDRRAIEDALAEYSPRIPAALSNTIRDWLSRA
jgi:HEAT repeat protein